ncbi:hypothetical protein BIW11_10044 [Tropilaelaps mercedesae]|uniref:Uncharacterized protein n=1 Tax=Tropilaelaps mercedesae TaxID=418985 RepID=A0A1V9XHU5_9ACAR|nr:hypothetical protein BIW11_10044 [Tropilaelaps mercedesae]
MFFWRPSTNEAEEIALIEFALDHHYGETYALPMPGEFIERLGTKLAITGRIISTIGDALTGFGRWLQSKRSGTYAQGAARFVLLKAAGELGRSPTFHDVERLASRVIAAVMAEVAHAKIADDQLEGHLKERLDEVSIRLVKASKTFGPEDVDQTIQNEVAARILEKLDIEP